MIPPVAQPQGGGADKRLREIYRALPEAERETLLAFAEFLQARTEEVPRELPPPKDIPRPGDGETVVKAVRRLSQSYFMLDKAKMLNETSALMAQHIMQGRDAEEVIDELEQVFATHYERLVGGEK